MGESSETGVHVACGDEWVLVRLVVVDGHRRGAAEVLSSGELLREA